MHNKYEIQCPNCSGALVVPADNYEELVEFWKQTKMFQCPCCNHIFQGLGEKMQNPDDAWKMLVDINGSRYGQAAKLLNEVAESARDPYLYIDKSGEVVAADK